MQNVMEIQDGNFQLCQKVADLAQSCFERYTTLVTVYSTADKLNIKIKCVHGILSAKNTVI
jgi:hypothetical protein